MRDTPYPKLLILAQSISVCARSGANVWPTICRSLICGIASQPTRGRWLE